MEPTKDERVGEESNISNHLPDHTSSTALSHVEPLEEHTYGEMSHPTTCLIDEKMIKTEAPDNLPDDLLEEKLKKGVDLKKKKKNKETTNKKFVCIVCQNSFAYG